jgi:SAM-dependent methyltransferase
VGVDISAKALALAATRLQLHTTDPARVELIRITDSQTHLPVPDTSIDYIYSGGVLHHTTDPEAILRELHRVLKPGGEGCLMVYNRHSIWFHLHAAYIKMILERAYPGLSVDDVFAKTTDTETCPIARAYSAGDFGTLLERTGFAWEFVGGYLSTYELDILAKHRRAAESERRLPAEHREFLRDLTSDTNGYPMYRGKHAGIGGVYRLRKSA